MIHEDAGNYAAKHPDKKLDERIASRVKEISKDKKISCTGAHSIASELGIAPMEVGIAIDLLDVKVNKCQMGLFGYSGQKHIEKVTDKEKPEIRQAVKSGLVNGRLPCLSAWEIADKFGITKMKIAGIAESMGIKINQCQLGAFK